MSRLAFVLIVPALFVPEALGQSVDFTRDVRPVLSRHCFKCHGPDEGARKGKFGLDLREAATGKARSGQPAIVPGKPEESELIRRIFATEEREIMPPPSAK